MTNPILAAGAALDAAAESTDARGTMPAGDSPDRRLAHEKIESIRSIVALPPRRGQYRDRMDTRVTRVRIVLADDHPLLRAGLSQVISADPRFDLVGEADQGTKALELILQTQPDLAVLDIFMPSMDGLAVAAALQHAKCRTRLVVLTMSRDEQLFNQAMNLGIQGYLLKENAVGELMGCLTAVAAGNAYVSPSLTPYLLPRRNRALNLIGDQPQLAHLTAGERRILRRIAERKTTREIATELCISPRTVESHRARMCRKLALHGNNGLLRFALENRSVLIDLV